MEPTEYVGKYYRIQISEQDIENLFCLPSTKQTHNETIIPKNSIVKIINFYPLYGANWFEVEYNKRLYLVTESQVNDCFIFIHIRKDKTRLKR